MRFWKWNLSKRISDHESGTCIIGWLHEKHDKTVVEQFFRTRKLSLSWLKAPEPRRRSKRRWASPIGETDTCNSRTRPLSHFAPRCFIHRVKFPEFDVNPVFIIRKHDVSQGGRKHAVQEEGNYDQMEPEDRADWKSETTTTTAPPRELQHSARCTWQWTQTCWKKLPQDGHIQRHNKTGKSNCDATIHPQQSLLVDLAENLV